MSETYTSAGTYTYEIPVGAVELMISAYGGEGGNGSTFSGDSRWESDTGSGDDAGEVSFNVNTNDISDTLTVEVGGDASGRDGGENGGGEGGYSKRELSSYEVIARGGGGGGRTRIMDGGTVLAVAGGGGGGGAATHNPSARFDDIDSGNGGNGGRPNGQDGQDAVTSDQFGIRAAADGGGGATQSSHGNGGEYNDEENDDGVDGNSGSGGGGGDGVGDYDSAVVASGAGGHGHFAGGSGGVGFTRRDGVAAGGGGGSSWASNTVSSVEFDSGFRSERVEIEAVVIEVTNLTAEYVGSQEVDISWDGDNAEEYEIERNGAVIDTVPDEAYTDTGVSENTETVYEVFALDSAGTRADSETLTVTTGGPPENAIATEVGDVEFEIAADEPNGNYEQVTLRRDSFLNEGDPELLTETQDASGGFSYTDTDGSLLPGVEYDYRLTATYRAGESSVNSAFGLVDLEPPTDLAVVEETPEGAILSFTDNAGFRTEYRMYAFEEGEPGELFDTNDEALVEEGETAEAEFGGLLNGKEYTVTVSVATPDTEAFDE